MKMKTEIPMPQKVSDLDMAFPVDVYKLMPSYDDIPDDFKNDRNQWVKWQGKWFFEGLKSMPTAKDGIDGDTAIRHLSSIQGSFQPKHEHKQAAVAYLASLWFIQPSE